MIKIGETVRYFLYNLITRTSSVVLGSLLLAGCGAAHALDRAQVNVTAYASTTVHTISRLAASSSPPPSFLASPTPSPKVPTATPVSSPIPTHSSQKIVRLLYFMSPRTGWIVLGQSPSLSSPTALYRTTDGGIHWARMTTGSVHSPIEQSGITAWDALRFTNANDGWAVVTNGVGACQAGFAIYATADGGAHWHLKRKILGSDGPVTLSQYLSSSSLWFANGSCAAPATLIWTSSDTGASWNTAASISGPKAAQGAGPTANSLIAEPHGALLITTYAVYNRKGQPIRTYLQQISLPQETGVTKRLPFAHRILRLSFITATVGWIETTQGLYQTHDGGTTWTPVQTPPGFHHDAAPPLIEMEGNTLAPVEWVATGQHLWKTTNNGQTWSSIALP